MSSLDAHIISVLRSHKVLGHLVSWYYDTEYGNITQGFVRGFLLYFVPVTLLRRKLKLETLQRAVAVGSFVSTFRALHGYISNGIGKELFTNLTKRFGLSEDQEKGLKKAFAGALGAAVLLGVDKSLVNSIFVLWCLVRALPFVLPNVPQASVLVMCLSASQIAVTWVKRPLLMDQGYRRFLTAQGAKSKQCLSSIIRDDFPSRNICLVNHPGETCLQHGFTYWSGGFVRALKLYLPLYFVFFLISKRRSVRSSILGLIRSSTFLATYCSAAWVLLCLFYHKSIVSSTATLTPFALWMRLWVSGLAVLIERPSRRKELAQYCSTYALDTVYRYYENKGLVKPSYPLGVLIGMFAWSVLLWNSHTQPKFLSRWLFGIQDDPEKLKGKKVSVDSPQVEPQIVH